MAVRPLHGSYHFRAPNEHLEGEPLRPAEYSLSSANFCPLVLKSSDDSCQNRLLLRSLSNDVFRIPSFLLYPSLGFLLQSLSFPHRFVPTAGVRGRSLQQAAYRRWWSLFDAYSVPDAFSGRDVPWERPVCPGHLLSDTRCSGSARLSPRPPRNTLLPRPPLLCWRTV